VVKEGIYSFVHGAQLFSARGGIKDNSLLSLGRILLIIELAHSMEDEEDIRVDS